MGQVWAESALSRSSKSPDGEQRSAGSFTLHHAAESRISSQTLQLATLTWGAVLVTGDAPAGGEDCRLGVHRGTVYCLVGHDRDDADERMAVWRLDRDNATWSQVPLGSLSTPLRRNPLGVSFSPLFLSPHRAAVYRWR